MELNRRLSNIEEMEQKNKLDQELQNELEYPNVSVEAMRQEREKDKLNRTCLLFLA